MPRDKNFNAYAAFVRRMEYSRRGTFALGWWLHMNGYEITILPLRICPPDEAPAEYSDHGYDITGTKDGVTTKFDAKMRGINFAGRSGFPFPSIYVNRRGPIDRHWDDLPVHVSVSDDLRWMAIIGVDTRPEWFLCKAFNKDAQQEEEYYALATERASFVRLLTEGEGK